jgi:putative phosphoribosyl transferase
MLAAIHAARKLGARSVVAALPVASDDAYRKLCEEADDVICLSLPTPFYSVGQWYADFMQATDEDVTALLTWHCRFDSLSHGGIRVATTGTSCDRTVRQ